LSVFQRPRLDFAFGTHRLKLGLDTKIMGVLNVTPDSFSDGGNYLLPDLALEQALRMEREGAHVLDLGGESTKPGSKPVTVKEEIRRIRPVLKRLAKKIRIPISIDTYKYDVAMMALDEGALILNDIRALGGDKRLPKLVVRYNAGVVLMHMKGTPDSMQKDTRYKNFLNDVLKFLREAADRALQAGVKKESIMIDPGFGFGKSTEQNVELLSRLDVFAKLRFPVLVGVSRKNFIGQILGAPVSERLYGSLAAASAAIHRGAHFIRAHDVLPHREMAALVDETFRARAVL
jgi:dihydropteroate synthase